MRLIRILLGRRRPTTAPQPAEGPDLPDTSIVAAYAANEEKYRAASKWLVGTFAAVAGLVLTGASLADVQDLTRSDAQDAVRGMVVAMGGAVLAALGGLWILVPFEESVRTIGTKRLFFFDRVGTKRIRADPTILGRRYDDIDRFLDDYERARVEYRRAASQRCNTDSLAQLGHTLDEFEALAVRTVAKAHFERFKRRFQISVGLTMVGVIVVAVGVYAFVDAAYVGSEPAKAFVTLSADGQETLAPVLGDDCVRSAIPVVIVSGSPPDADVLVTGGDCQAAQFRMTDGLGTIVIRD